MNPSTVALVGMVVVPFGCSSGDQADLPPGWDGAQQMVTFSQSACTAAMPGTATESIRVTTGKGSVAVAYHNAPFRCDQAVQGFVTVGGGHLNYLVQPTDMNPSSVARCDCLYEIAMNSFVAAGPETVTVYRRADHASGNASAVQVGTASVTVP
jgi:hypothetical protein